MVVTAKNVGTQLKCVRFILNTCLVRNLKLLNKSASVMNLNVLITSDFCSDLLVFVFCDVPNLFVLSCWRQGLLQLSII